MIHNVAIIGSGPAGYTAALYNARASLNPVVFAGAQPGGQLTITTEVENYPGFPEGIMGPELMVLFRNQVERFGVDVRDETVTKVDLTATPFRIWVDETEHQARAIIIATGASAKWIGLPGETTFGGYGVSACATCDGFFFRNKDVLVVGGGDTAMEEAHYLSKIVRHVTLVNRSQNFRASQIMLDRVRATPNITIVTDTVVEDILGVSEPAKRVTGARLRNVVTGEVKDQEVSAVFVAIGHQPNSSLFQGVLDMDETGYLLTRPDSTHTNVEGVFAAGDVADHVYRQAVTAAGMGCQAAIDAERWLAVQPPI